MYADARPVDPSHGQPYYGLQAGRSPSDEVQDGVDGERRESGISISAFNHQRWATTTSTAQTPQKTSFDQALTSSYQSPSGDNADQKRSRACEACRGLKVRCDMDPNTPNEPCKRCKKASRQCIVTQPSRRRQKKADTRVAELERKIDALTAVIAQQNTSPSHTSYPHQSAPEPYPLHGDQGETPQSSIATAPAHHDTRPSMSNSTPQSYHPHLNYPSVKSEPISQPSNKRRRIESISDPNSIRGVVPADFKAENHEGYQGLRHELHNLFPQKVKERLVALVEPELMRTIFDHFCTNLLPVLPCLAFPPGTSAEDVLESKPILMLSIMAVGCGFIVTMELRQSLYDEILAAFAEAIIEKGVKSLEIVQALQVATLWQRPPAKPHSANFYVLIHMAAVMAMDLGLGKRFRPHKMKRGFGGPGSDLPPGPPQVLVDSDSMEARRAWMTCYFLCASISQMLRRPNILHWTNYMAKCVDLLETSPDAAPLDRLLAQHIKIQHICEEINTSFALDDPDATSISILDPKVAYTLNVLESQLREWEAKIPDDLRRPELALSAHTTTLYLHEIALHVNHNTDDFCIPFTEERLKSGSENGFAATLTQNQMASIEACLKASHNAIETFCSFDANTHVYLPPLLYFVRVMYALIVLTKIHVAVIAPGSELGKIIKQSDVRAEEYLNRLWDVFQEIATQHRMGPHHKAQHILGILRDWVSTHQHGDSIKPKPSATNDSGMHAPDHASKSTYPPRSNSNDSLRVLSEAATAGANPQQQTANWSFDSPSAVSYNPYGINSNSVGQGSAASSTTVPTPQPYSSGNYDPAIFGPQGFQKGDGTDWTAASNMDFEQAVNVALQDLDFSGDLFGEF